MSQREQALRDRLARDPGDSAASRELAELVGAERGRKDEAVELWRRYADVVDIADKGRALLALARAQIEARRERSAIETLIQRSERWPDAEGLDLLGELLRRDGRLQEAAEALRRAIELSPEAMRPRIALITCLQALGRDAEVQRELEALSAVGAVDPAVAALVQELVRRRG